MNFSDENNACEFKTLLFSCDRHFISKSEYADLRKFILAKIKKIDTFTLQTHALTAPIQYSRYEFQLDQFSGDEAITAFQILQLKFQKIPYRVLQNTSNIFHVIVAKWTKEFYQLEFEIYRHMEEQERHDAWLLSEKAKEEKAIEKRLRKNKIENTIAEQKTGRQRNKRVISALERMAEDVDLYRKIA